MAAQLTLVLGGIASGKSAYAESLVRAMGLPMLYLATAQAYDSEMQAKIERHRASRGAGWTTVEAPLALADALHKAPPRITLFCLIARPYGSQSPAGRA